MSVLQLKALGISNLVRFDFPSAPPSKNLISALELLFALGALNEKGELTKPLGEQMSELPLHPTLSKMLLTSSTFNCTREVYPLNCKQARNRALHIISIGRGFMFYFILSILVHLRFPHLLYRSL